MRDVQGIAFRIVEYHGHMKVIRDCESYSQYWRDCLWRRVFFAALYRVTGLEEVRGLVLATLNPVRVSVGHLPTVVEINGEEFLVCLVHGHVAVS